MKIRMINLGGALGQNALYKIGASCYLLIITVFGRDYIIMIDCGMEMGDEDQVSWQQPLDLGRLASILNGRKINFILITHAHRDHVAAICVDVIEEHLADDAEVICTSTTRPFLLYALFDQIRMSSNKREARPYGEREIHFLKKRIRTVSRPQVIDLIPGVIDAYVERAGHIRGACSYIIRIREGAKVIKVMFSGDYAVHAQHSTLGAPLPPKEWRPDHLPSFDCTNGGESNLQTWEEVMREMADDGFNTVKAGDWAIYWAFAMDRSQTFAAKLNQLGLKTYLDGPSAQTLAQIMASPEGFWCEGDQSVDLSGVAMPDMLNDPLADAEPGAIIAPSGMCHGPAYRHVSRLITRETALLGAGGYQAPGTNGFKLTRARRGDRVTLLNNHNEPEEFTLAAQCKQYRPSGHSLRPDAALRIMELLRYSQFKEPMVGLCHASTGAFDWFEQGLNGRGFKTFRADREADRDIILVD